MINVHFMSAHVRSPQARRTLACQTGQSLMQAAVYANVAGIEADCGGLMTCATCHVYVHEPWASLLPAPGPDERGMLEFTAAPRRPGSRLSCQIQLTEALDGLTVDLPDSQH
jgi:ferredoxin, 2Fe-2S